MELRRYFMIIRRGWWIALGVPLVVLALSLLSFRPDPQRYRTGVKLAVTQAELQQPPQSLPDFNSYNSWQSSQFVVDDLPAIIKSNLFAADVSEWIRRERNLTVTLDVIQAAYEIERDHRIISMFVTAGSEQETVAIAQGSIAMIQLNGLRYWNRTSSGGLAVGVLDFPRAAAPLSRWPQPVTRLALRLVLALATGLGLTFLYHYLDRTVREQADLEALDVPMLATIPRE